MNQEISSVVCPASVRHPRQSEASIVQVGSRLLLAYSDYYDGRPKDNHPARIMGKWSDDDGVLWSPPFLLQENHWLNVMSTSLLALPSGRVLLAFVRKDTPKEWQLVMKHSDDGGLTWSEPSAISTSDVSCCMANDRLVRLSTGRLLAPVEVVGEGEGRMLHVWISDDDGATWHLGKAGLAPPENRVYHEPAVVELSDGTLAMYIRTLVQDSRYQFIHIAHSKDGGESWELYSEGGPGSTFAPCIVKKVPESNDLLLIWNNHMMRTSLTAAISRDDGETWKNLRLLEEEEDWPLSRSHTYPSLTFHNGNVHMTYWESHRHPETVNMFHLIYRRLPLEWFYEQRLRRAPVYDPARNLLSYKTEYDGELSQNE
jgi:hypothetical protein